MNIKKAKEEINKKRDIMRLTATEKEEIFRRVVATPRRSLLSDYYKLPRRFGWHFTSRVMGFYAAIVLLIFAVSGGGIMAYSSFSSLPGDALYGMKVKFIEPLTHVFTMKPLSHAKIEANTAIRRLDEAKKLLSQERLTQEHREEIEKRFKKKTDDFVKALEESIQTDSSHQENIKKIEEIKVYFEQSVNARADNLKSDAEKARDEAQKREAELLENAVRARVEQNENILKGLNKK